VLLLMLGVATVAGLSGYTGSVLARRRRRRARGVFVLGFLCGAVTGGVVRSRRRRRRVTYRVARCVLPSSRRSVAR
jgi:hypothetical protein